MNQQEPSQKNSSPNKQPINEQQAINSTLSGGMQAIQGNQNTQNQKIYNNSVFVILNNDSEQIIFEKLLDRQDAIKILYKVYDELPKSDLLPEVPGNQEITDLFKNILSQAKELRKEKVFFQTIQDELSRESQSKPRKTQSVQSYLLVVIKPVPKSPDIEKFCIDFWLIPDDKDTTLERFKKLNTDEQENQVLHSLEELEEDVPKLLDKFLEQLLLELELKHKDKEYNLIVEFFLPFNFLYTGVEHWLVTDYEKKKSVGKMFPVVVRSYERLELNYIRYRRRKWRRNWTRVEAVLNHTPNIELFQHIQCLDSCNWDKIDSDFQNDENKIGFIINSIPTENNKQFLFNAFLDTAIPLAIWIRKDVLELDKIATKLGELLTEKPLIELLDVIRKQRAQPIYDKKTLEEERWADHLSILWEDPNRQPPGEEVVNFIPTGQ